MESAAAPPASNLIRVVIQQPTLARYRVPVYKALAARPGLDIHVLYGSDGTVKNVPPDGFRATHVPLKLFHFGRSEVRWHKAQLDWTHPDHADVAVLSWSARYASLAPALIKARRLGVGTVLWGHGYSKTESTWRARTRASIANLADALLFYNNTTARKYIHAAVSRPSRVFVALNCLDQAPIRAAREAWSADGGARLAAFRREQAIEGRRILLFVSRFDPNNRAHKLLEVVDRLRHGAPDILAVFIGDGPDGPRLREITRERGLEDHVRFAGVIYDDLELAPWFLSSVALVYPANIGLSLIHAFGYGLPVITRNSADSQNPEFEALRHGENCLLYTPGELDSLTDQVSSLLVHPGRREDLSRGARRTITEQFTLDHMVDGMEQAIRFAYSQHVSGV